MNQWKKNDRVKVSPDHYGSGLQERLGTVLRITPGGYVEVDLDSFRWPAGIGIVAFRPEDLVATKKARRQPKPTPR
jgi:hypothetical protein